MKVGTNRESDLRRGKIIRSVIDDPANAKPRDPATLVGKNAGPTGNVLMIDANQVWDVQEAIEYVKSLQEIKPWFIEEPTAPDDILGHAAIRKALEPFGIGVATGEHAHNRMVFKQLMQVCGIVGYGDSRLIIVYDRPKRLMWRRLILVASLVSAKS
jgi:L-fuconate dehydratase